MPSVKVPMKPHLEYCILLLSPLLKQKSFKQEQGQRRVTSMIRRMGSVKHTEIQSWAVQLGTVKAKGSCRSLDTAVG